MLDAGCVTVMLNCISMKHPKNFGISSSRCVMLQAKIFTAIYEYMMDESHPFSARERVRSAVADWIYSFGEFVFRCRVPT